MAELIGLPYPPEVGDTALKPGTYDGACVFVTGAGTGLGKAIATEATGRVFLSIDGMKDDPLSLKLWS